MANRKLLSKMLGTASLGVGITFTAAATGANPISAQSQIDDKPTPTVYSDDVTLKNFHASVVAIGELAGRNVFIMTPEVAKNMGTGEWRKHPFVKSFYQKFPRFFAEPSLADIVYANWKKDLTKNIKSFNFTSSGKSVLGDGCLIMGSPSASVDVAAVQFGNIPKNLITQNFLENFDRISLLTYILLHEAAHCNQDIDYAGQDRKPGKANPERVLRFEIDADRQADIAYAKLIEKGAKLDPLMPEKMRALRFLAPAMPVTDKDEKKALSQTVYYFIGKHTHATGEGVSTGTNYMAASQSARAFNIAVQQIIRVASPEPLKIEVQDYTKPIVHEMMAELANATNKVKNIPQKERERIIDTLFPLISTTAEGARVAMVNPEYIFDAARLLAEKGTDLPNEKFPNVQQYAAKFLAAWNILGLAANAKLDPVPLGNGVITTKLLFPSLQN